MNNGEVFLFLFCFFPQSRSRTNIVFAPAHRTPALTSGDTRPRKNAVSKGTRWRGGRLQIDRRPAALALFYTREATSLQSIRLDREKKKHQMKRGTKRWDHFLISRQHFIFSSHHAPWGWRTRGRP